MITDAPIFIVGNSRSGTTMLGRIIDNHPEVHTFDELHFFERMVRGQELTTPASSKFLIQLIERLLTAERLGFFASYKVGRFRQEACEIVHTVVEPTPLAAYCSFLRYEAARAGSRRPCEQTPRYLFFAKEILDAVQDARVINMIRDPRAVLLSQKNKWRRRFLGGSTIPLGEAARSWVNYHPYLVSRIWLGAASAALDIGGHARFKSVRYEDLVSSPAVTISAICEFCDIQFDERMLNVPRVGSSSGDDLPQVRGINAGRCEPWKDGGLSATELDICARVSARVANEFRYDVLAQNVGRLRRVFCYFVLLIKVPFVLLLNLGRTRSLLDSFRRRFG